MTARELEEIENRAKNASNGLMLDILKKEDFDFLNMGRADIYRLVTYILDLESQVIHWIPVTERLPEERKEILGWMKWGECAIVSYTEGDWHDYEGDALKDTVTHWSELPAMPEEEKDVDKV